ncbi:MAG: DUF554 domain-containing protein [Bacteroidetes bacterium]|nr:DUF554 domain-containing protein [Bacteroidota bacterium]MDA0904575.1 DUF554 domain-containing protein [Bacteroidota bacterium]MDA1243304.1 DUF554 domain-containing protein [Bacteroidota bacterium]
MVGTLFNTLTVLLGASIGLALGARWSEALRDKVFVAIGLFTTVIGMLMALDTEAPIDMFLSLVLGTALGHRLGFQRRVDMFQAQHGNKQGGFLEAMMLFCLGSMTLIGCMEDGLLGKPDLLIVKGTMDLISSAFLAAALGRGVLWAAGGVLAFQGTLTLVFMAAGQGMDASLIQELSALGGVLMIGLGCQLLGILPQGHRSWPLVDMLPALTLLPAVRWAHEMLLEFVA